MLLCVFETMCNLNVGREKPDEFTGKNLSFEVTALAECRLIFNTNLF